MKKHVTGSTPFQHWWRSPEAFDIPSLWNTVNQRNQQETKQGQNCPSMWPTSNISQKSLTENQRTPTKQNTSVASMHNWQINFLKITLSQSGKTGGTHPFKHRRKVWGDMFEDLQRLYLQFHELQHSARTDFHTHTEGRHPKSILRRNVPLENDSPQSDHHQRAQQGARLDHRRLSSCCQH